MRNLSADPMSKEIEMRAFHAGERRFRSGKVGWIVLWLLGIPIPILLILFLLRGCT